MEQLNFIDKIRNLIYILGVKLKYRGDKLCTKSNFTKFDVAAYNMVVKYCKKTHKKFGVSYKIYRVVYKNHPDIFIEVKNEPKPCQKYLKGDIDFRWKLERYYKPCLWDYLDEGWSIYDRSQFSEFKLIYSAL